MYANAGLASDTTLRKQFTTTCTNTHTLLVCAQHSGNMLETQNIKTRQEGHFRGGGKQLLPGCHVTMSVMVTPCCV